MTFLHAAGYAVGFTLRVTWLIILPVIGLAALMGVPIVPI